MMRALSTAATGMKAQELGIEVVSNNLANMSTTAYQRQRAEFSDLLYQSYKRSGSDTDGAGNIVPTGVQVGLGVKVAGVYRIPESGELIQTNNPTAVAIRGKGYFRVTLSDGSFGYTRDGDFQLSPNGVLVSSKGYVVSPQISIPQNTKIEINDAGQVSTIATPTSPPTLLGQLDLVDFLNTAGLEAIGDNLFLETAASGAPIIGVPNQDSFGSLLQGWIESSNVNPIIEITTLIAAQRAYELCSKIIQAGDEMLKTLNASKQ